MDALPHMRVYRRRRQLHACMHTYIHTHIHTQPRALRMDTIPHMRVYRGRRQLRAAATGTRGEPESKGLPW